MLNTIKFRKFDTETMTYTNESYEQTLDRFVKNYCLRAEHYITKSKLEDYAKEHNIHVDSELKKPAYIDALLLNMTEVQILDMADTVGIGVNCYRLFDIGITMEEYKTIYEKLKVVGKEPYAENKKRNIYSLRQYFEYRENPSKFYENTSENEFMDIPEEELEGLPFK